MQNYGQAPGYQRPRSTTNFAGQQAAPPVPPPPPGYGAHQAYQSTAPQAHGQWVAPTPTHSSNPWNQQPRQSTGGYNVGTYGTMPGAQHYSYPLQQQDQPPPPPPKPHGFAAAVQQQQQQQQQNAQGWAQQPQQNVGFTSQAQQGGYPIQGTPQQSYDNAAPPLSSAVPGGSYFPPAQGGRPSSIYGATQPGAYPNAPPGGQQAPSVISPNEQQPAYIPPSLTGHGVQAYMPSNTNPAPGVYVPPPPDVPVWQQAQHAPLQGATKTFKYTKPTVDPSFCVQDYQGIQPMQHASQPPPLPPRLGEQVVQHHQPQHGYGQSVQGQYSQQAQTPHQSQQASQCPPPPHGHVVQQSQHPAQYSQLQNQWQPPPPPDLASFQHVSQPSYKSQLPNQQSSWHPSHQAQGALARQQHSQVSGQEIQTPKPFGRTDTATSNFYNQFSPQSQPVSPISNRASVSTASGYHINTGRTESVSSIALANLHAQRAENKTSSPKPPSNLSSPPPPRDDKSKFSVLGVGTPSDWERFGDDEEIDDEELFGVKKEETKTEVTQPNSIELPAHVPSPPSTYSWPSPATHPAISGSADWGEAYVPTPPSVATDLASPQDFVVGDAVVAPLRTTPKPTQNTQPPAQGNFSRSDGMLSKASTPIHSDALCQPPPLHQGYVVDSEHWAAQSVPSQQHQPVSVSTSLVIDEGAWEVSQLTPTQPSGPWGAQARDDVVSSAKLSAPGYTVELKAKDDVIAQLRIESEREKSALHAEIGTLKADSWKLQSDFEAAKTYAAAEADVLRAQIETMRIAADQASINSDASRKETGLTIERLKEDVEGKEHNIEECEKTIVDLRRQLEAEKTKEVPEPTPAALIPDMDPWYASSLERYIAMLRGEAHEPQIEGKIRIFKAFMKVESDVRGIEYYDAARPVSIVEPEILHNAEARSRATSNTSVRRQDLSVQVPQESSPTEDYDYSPGGRPILPRTQTLPPTENVQVQPPVASPSVQSTTILTPTSSVDDDSNKTPVQPLPEEQSLSQYKAYVPPTSMPIDTALASHRHTMTFPNVPAVPSPSVRSDSKGHDEIFFGAHQPRVQKSASKPSSSELDIPVPAPLTLNPRRPPSAAAAPPPAKDDPDKVLARLLPSHIDPSHSSRLMENLKGSIARIETGSDKTDELTKSWEKSASLGRRKLDDARRKRQEDNEEHNDDLFNGNEISYAEMNQLEDEFKQEEAELKAQEDKDEYKSYVDAVFNPVFDKSQAEIKAFVDLYVEAERLLETSTSAMKSMEVPDAPHTEDCLELLKILHEHIEKRHDKVIHIVAERDKRYKKTETQPLYAAGNISKMKSVEKQFENAEKQAVLKAKREKAERIGGLVSLAEDIVVDAVETEQKEIDSIIAAIKALDDGTGDPGILTRAHDTLRVLKSSSKALLYLSNALKTELNDAVIDAEIAAVKAESADKARLQELEKEKSEGRKKLISEFERRVTVLEQDEGEIEELLKRKYGIWKGGVEKGVGTEEAEREKRLRMALEKAKRRNGDV